MKEVNEQNKLCPNCQTSYDISYKYCPECGQANSKLKLDFKYFVSEFIAAMFNVDSKIFRTLKLLFFKPGKLSKEFIAGRRNSYIAPVRLYLIGSLIYFTISSFFNNPIKYTGDLTNESDSIANILTLNNLDSLQVILPIEDSSNLFEGSGDSILRENFGEARLKKLGTKEGREKLKDNIMGYIPIGMFIFVPLTALLFFLLFRKDTYYIEHLIFVIHLQTLFYLIFSILNLFDIIVQSTIIEAVTAILFLGLLFIWIKKYYNVKWSVAIGKSFLFLIMYSFIFFIFFFTIVGISFFFL